REKSVLSSSVSVESDECFLRQPARNAAHVRSAPWGKVARAAHGLRAYSYTDLVATHVVWGIVGHLAGHGLDRAITNPCPKKDDICLPQTAELTCEIPSAILP